MLGPLGDPGPGLTLLGRPGTRQLAVTWAGAGKGLLACQREMCIEAQRALDTGERWRGGRGWSAMWGGEHARMGCNSGFLASTASSGRESGLQTRNLHFWGSALALLTWALVNGADYLPPQRVLSSADAKHRMQPALSIVNCSCRETPQSIPTTPRRGLPSCSLASAG